MSGIAQLGFMDWILILSITVFLFLLYEHIFVFPTEMIQKRLESMNIFTSGTDKEKILQQSLIKRSYMMLEERTVLFIRKRVRTGDFSSLKTKFLQANDRTKDPVQHWAQKTIFAIAGGLFGLITHNPGILAIAILVGFMYPDYKLKEKIQKRQHKIKTELPDFLDLLASVAPSTKTLEDAIEKVCERSIGELPIEFRQVLQEINAGRRRRDALSDLAIRCGIPEIDTLISQINQSELFGTAVADTLSMQATKIRKLKQVLAEIKARKAAITLVLPSVFLLFTIMVILAGPSIVQFIGSVSMFS